MGEGLWIHGDYKYKGREFAHGGWKQRDLFKNAILQENSDLKYPENGVITTNFSSKSCITNVLERIVQNLNPGHIVLIEEFTYEENDKWNTFSTVESPEVTAFVKSYNNLSGNNVRQTLIKEGPIIIADYKTIPNNDFLEVYEKGRLHYNNAAKLKLYELPKYQDDYTKQGEDNFTALVSQIYNHLRRALPFFQKAESINPNDESTLIALTEIFVELGEFDKAQLFKDRLKKVQSGITLTSSYF